MINGIIKLFYSEIVKTKINGMPDGEYTLRQECKEIRNITLKIDSAFLKILKLIIGMILLILSFKIDVVLGIGIFLVELTYIVYKIKLEEQIIKSIENLRNNIELPRISMLSEKAKSGINSLIILLVIGLITNFNWIIIISFVFVFLFTIKDIYSNIK